MTREIVRSPAPELQPAPVFMSTPKAAKPIRSLKEICCLTLKARYSPKKRGGTQRKGLIETSVR